MSGKLATMSCLVLITLSCGNPSSGSSPTTEPQVPLESGTMVTSFAETIPDTIPKRGTPEYGAFIERCNLGVIGGYESEYRGHPMMTEPGPEPMIDGRRMMDFAISARITSGSVTTVSETVSLPLVSLDDIPYKGSGLDAVWPTGDGPDQTILVYPDASAVRFVEETQQGLRFSPDDCNTSEAFSNFASRLTKPNDLDLLHELQTAVRRTNECIVSTPAGEGDKCIESLAAQAVETDPGHPLPAAVGNDWLTQDPLVRGLDFAVVEPSFRSQLMLVPISVDASGIAPETTFRLRCRLGNGYAWSGHLPGVIPLPTCRFSDTTLSYVAQDPSTGSPTLRDIAIFSTSDLDERLGSVVMIDWNHGAPKVSIRRMDPGELEERAGLSREQVETIRKALTGG